MISFTKKKVFSVFFIFFTFFKSTVFATDDDTPSKKPLKPPRDMRAKLLAGFSAPARTDVRGSWDLFISGSFIYWQAIEEALQLATDSGNFTNRIITEKTYDMDFNWKPGFKVSAGMHFDYDHWSLFATYLRLHTKNTKAYSEPINSSITPYWLRKVSQAYDFWASWYLDLDIIDLGLGRKLFLGEKLLVTPHLGIELALIDQKYYMNAKSYNSTDDVFFSPYSRVKSDSWGLGPKMALDSEWKFSDTLSFIINAAGKILYTSYKVKHRTYNIYYNSSFFEDHFNWNRKYLRPMVDIAGGFSWAKYFGEDFWHFELAVLYEFHILWNQNVMRSAIATYDLYLNGLTITATLDF